MSTANLTGGGSMDGAILELPPAPALVTVNRNGRSWYVRSVTGIYEFAGYGEIGEVMSGFMRKFSEAAKRDAEAIAAASAAQGCSSCGRTFGSPGALAAAHDGRCLPDHMIEGMLTEISGVWCSRGSDTARR